jgi:hypothetical protein
MAAHAIGRTDTAAASPDATPTSVKVLRNVDVIAFAVALPLFLVAGFPMLGYLTALGAWIVQRLINELAVRKAESADDVRTRVGLIAGSMILRGWIVAGIIIAVGLGDEDAGLAAAVLFLAVFTLHFTMTMAMRPFETPTKPAKATARKTTARKPGASS